jgi:hypothetical protein
MLCSVIIEVSLREGSALECAYEDR